MKKRGYQFHGPGFELTDARLNHARTAALGKRWQWARRSCECGHCKKCKNRERTKAAYQLRKAGIPAKVYKRAPREPMKRYEWDRTK